MATYHLVRYVEQGAQRLRAQEDIDVSVGYAGDRLAEPMRADQLRRRPQREWR